MNEKSISVYQLSAALILSRVFTFLLNLPVYSQPLPIMNVLISELVSASVGAVIIIPSALLANTRITASSGIVGKTVNILYIAVFAAFAAVTFFDSYKLFSGMVLEGAGIVFFSITIFAAVIYAAKCGIEGIMRTGTVIAVIFAVSFAFIIISSLGKIDFTEFKTQYVNSDYRLNTFLGSAEYVVFAVLINRAKGNVKASAGIFILISTAISFAAVIITACVLGNLAEYQSQPFFILSSISQISIFTRLKSVHSIIFALLAAFKLSLLFLCMRICCERLERDNKKQNGMPKYAYIIMLSAAVISAAACVFTGLFSLLDYLINNLLAAAVFGGIIPLAELVYLKIKGVK